MTTIESVLQTAHDRGASDVVLLADSTPFMRLEGQWLPIAGGAMSAAECNELVSSLIPSDRLATLQRERELNFSTHVEPFGRLRFNAHYQRDSLAATIRLIWPRVRTIEELGLRAELAKAALRHQGLILVCGRAGAGKSTTLAAMVHHVLENRRAHVITIEDPIEFVHGNGIGVCEQRELQSDTLNWQEALKNVLRQSPDVIVIGELQNRDSIATAVTAAETGHLVMASLHAQDAVQCISRVVDVFPADQQAQIRLQLSNTLAAVLAQELVPSLDKGRVLATEFILVNGAIRNLIRTGDYIQIHNSVLGGRAQGMHTMQDSLERLLERGVISQEEMIHRMNENRQMSMAR